MKRLARSIFYGLLMQAFAFYLVFMTQTEAAARWLLWNVSIALLVAGPMPVVGQGRDGPISEPTAAHVGMAGAGIILGIAAYSVLIFAALGASGARRARAATKSAKSS